MDVNHKAEVEKLARTLRQNKVAHSESQAYQMAEDMLSTSKKVHQDFKDRDEKIYGQARNLPEMEMAQKVMEKITQNMSKGKSDVRINLGELDLQTPLKELVSAEETPAEAEEEDDAVLVSDPAVQKAIETPPQREVLKQSADSPEVINVDDDDFFDDDDDNKDDTEEEKAGASVVVGAEHKEEEEGEFSIKEL